jgi:RimJ/RimL family protein N-acetyltransferase
MAPYYKEGVLKDGTRVILRPLVKEDREKLIDFFRRLDEKELSFLRSDVRDPAVIDHWMDHLDYQRVFPLVAEAEGRIVGDATLHMRKVGWKRHLGNVRVVVAKDYQGRGLATLLINELVELAGEFGLEKLVAEIHLQSVAALNVFKKAGFSVKAVFEDLVKDPAGKSSDLVVMVCNVQGLDSVALEKSWGEPGQRAYRPRILQASQPYNWPGSRLPGLENSKKLIFEGYFSITENRKLKTEN